MGCAHDPKTETNCCNYKDPSKIGKALVLSCMDLRVVDDVVAHLNGPGNLENEYDLVAMAGAALGATTPLKPNWHALFWDHVELAIALHSVEQIIIVEHQDCGAYRAFDYPASQRGIHGSKDANEQLAERQSHAIVASRLKREILERYPQVIKEVHLLYAALNEKDPLKFDLEPLEAVTSPPRSAPADPAPPGAG